LPNIKKKEKKNETYQKIFYDETNGATKKQDKSPIHFIIIIFFFDK
jgi:hypothetical protein